VGTQPGAGEPIEVVSTFEVLRAEYELLWRGKPPPSDLEDYADKAFGNGQAALCLSGGGIRSASFALGVLQALSRKKLLTHFHYLSTVSGGGYMGAFLQRWIHTRGGDAEAVMTALGGDDEPVEVTHLRQNSNFITPRVGFSSNDTWTVIAIFSRNILINWLLFAPLIMLVALLPNLFASGLEAVPQAVRDHAVILDGLILLSSLFAGWSLFSALMLLPSYRRSDDIAPGDTDGLVFRRIFIPAALWSICGTLALSAHLLAPGIDPVPVKLPLMGVQAVIPGPLSFAIFTAVGMVGALFAALLTLRGQRREALGGDVFAWLGAIVVVAVAVWLGGKLFASLAVPPAHAATSPDMIIPEVVGPGKIQVDPWSAALLATLGPLWLVGSNLLGTVVFVAFRPSVGAVPLARSEEDELEEAGAARDLSAGPRPPAGDLAVMQPDADREWLARLSAIKLKPILLWAVAAFSALLLNQILALLHVDTSATGLFALATGGSVAAAGKSNKTGSTVKSAGRFLFKHLSMNFLIALGTALFAISIFVLFGRIEERLAEKVAPHVHPVAFPTWIDPAVGAHVAIALVLLVALMLLRGQIQVNRFSLNGLYRNRLARGFLGAARKARKADPFTGFDAHDNIRMHVLLPRVKEAEQDRYVLYPVVNVALNVTQAVNLAWQERKAEPFVFTPKYSGSAMLTMPPAPWQGAYIASSVYGGNEPDLAMPGAGVTLATAVSISGAAASPNMGYHSSPATAFLMTLFNVRLGAWLPNPARAQSLGEDVRRSDPSDSLRALLRELAGSTDDQGRDIYLSDGGHFENLGLYEMVRRRCAFILLSDAGADPLCTFEDLGNAVRKIKIDFGIEISFDALRISSRSKPIHPQYAWALATIHYSPTRKGRLLYIKPSLFGDDVPVDVRAYAEGSATFPHESTADQFFSESQFESYRHLGFQLTDELGAEDYSKPGLAGFFADVDAQPREGEEGESGWQKLVDQVRHLFARGEPGEPQPG
jgi:Patatin-like phospholipase